MTKQPQSEQSARILNGMQWLVGAMSLSGFWYGFYLTYKMIHGCSGLECSIAFMPGLICLTSFIIFLLIVSSLKILKDKFQAERLKIFAALVGAAAILIPIIYIRLAG